MKKTLTLIVAAAAALTAMAYSPVTLPVIPADPALEAKVMETLSAMTLEQKVGQMLQLQIDVVGTFGPDGRFALSKAKVDSVISRYKVGSFLNTPGSTSLSAAEWDELIATLQESSMRLNGGLPVVYGLDEIHGTTYVNDGVLFPQGINMAATFDPRLVEESAEITAWMTRAANCPWTFTPTLDLARDPRWPRFWENYGEDALVNAVMGAAAVRGFQGSDPNRVDGRHIAATLKHYMGYGSPFSGKDRTPAVITASDLRDKHFAPFLEGLKSGALTVMVNSASVNGTPVHASWELLTRWLKDDLQWDGLIVTDWADINNLYTREHVAADKKDAIRIAVNAGVDMAMEPYKADFCELLIELVNEGKVAMSRIDDAATRCLRLKYRLGLFEQPNTSVAQYPEFGSGEWDGITLEAAVRSMVLLKNDAGLLPLGSDAKILVTGPTACSMRALNGGWSYSWQGNLAERYAERYNTIYEGLAAKFGADNVTYVPTVTFPERGKYYDEESVGTAEAVRAAAEADVIVACVGENSYCETPGNLTDLYLSGRQRDMVKALAQTGKPIVLVINSGRPRIIADIEPLATAVVEGMLPGNRGGDALAALLSGERNFSGKLPFTYPREINSLTTYDYKASEEAPKMEGSYDYDARVNVQWPFGYGRSYTTFEYSNLRVSHSGFRAGDELTVRVDVANTGERAGVETVMVYTTDCVASVVPDNKRLRAFASVALEAGEKREVELRIAASDLAFVNAQGQWTLEEGDFTLRVGSLTAPLQCEETFTWSRPNI